MNHRTNSVYALAMIAGLAVSGCEREDAAGDALQKAHVKLASLSPFGTTLPAGDTKLKAYNEVISTLKTAVDTGTETQIASASLLIAQSQMGLAEPQADRASEIERDVFNQLSSLRSDLSQYRMQSAGAEAAASYNPAKELAEIDRQDQERTAQVAKEQAAKGEIEKKVADLRAQAKAKLDESRARRQQAGALKQQVANQSATQGEQTLIESQKISREADALDVKAAQLEAQAATVAPQVVEIQNTIERLNKQKDLLGKERVDVGTRATASQKQASDLRAAAAKTAEAIKTKADALHELITGELAETAKKAASGFSMASGTAKKAVKELKGTAQLIVGTAQQGLGDVHLNHGRGLQVYSYVLESMTLAKPALPGAEALAARLSETKAAEKEALDAAFEAYKGADAAYQASGGGGDAKARIDKINARLRELIKLSGGSEDIIEAKEQAAPESAPTETPAAPSAAATPGGPQETLAAFLDQSGSAESKADLFYTSSPAEKDAVAAYLRVAEKGKKLNEVCKAKFGGDLQEAGGQMMAQMGGGVDPSKLANLKASDIPVTVNGESAEATFPGAAKPIKLRQVDGKWKIEFASMIPVPPEQMAMFGAMMAPAAKVMDELIADVQAGKYADQQAVLQALMQKMMQGAMQNMQGGPGGG